MARIHEIGLVDIMGKLPEINNLDTGYFEQRRDDLFLCALGFEDRCCAIPEIAAGIRKYYAGTSLCFEYSTNSEDNEANRIRLTAALNKFSGAVHSIPCDTEDFAGKFKTWLQAIVKSGGFCRVTFDVSACSSRLILTIVCAALKEDIDLTILYSEANVYHPTKEEYDDNLKDQMKSDRGLGIEQGVGSVIFSSEHPGVRSDQLAEAVIIFPTFKSERTRAVLAAIDDSLLEEPSERVVWIVGKPHHQDNYWRADAMRDLNKIQARDKCVEVCTFDYRRTLECLDRIYASWDCYYNVTISLIGSKMQNVGAALFWYMRQNVSMVFAAPESYKAKGYSEGRGACWRLSLGATEELRRVLDSVGQLKLC